MTFFLDTLRLLTFNGRALRSLAARKRLVPGFLWLGSGFITFAVFRHFVYANLYEPIPGLVNPGLLDLIIQISFVQALIFFSVVSIEQTLHCPSPARCAPAESTSSGSGHTHREYPP